MLKRLALSFVCALAAGGAVAATQGGPIPVPLPLFPPSNWWNTDITNAVVDPNSANFISFINNGGTTTLHPDFGGNDPDHPGHVFGFPYIIVNGSQTKLTVLFPANIAPECDGVDHNTNQSFPFYPVPAEPQSMTGWIEDGPPGTTDERNTNDRHMLIVDQTNNALYELYNVWYDGTFWEAFSGAFFDMSNNHRRPDTWTSADAGGLAILPGLVRYDEVSGPNEIGHAFRVTLRASNGYVYPASHEAGNMMGALPMGARLRLKASKDISMFTADVQKIFRAFKKYGLIMADNGTDMYVSGNYDVNWNNDVLNPAFASLSASDFDVVKLGWRPARGDFNADGNSDVIWRKSTTGENAMWVMNGTTITSPVLLPTVSDTNWKMAGVGDFNGDGKADIIWQHSTTGQVAIWLMNGSTISSAAIVTTLSDLNWKIAGVGDFNVDGKSDVVWRNQATGQVVVWLMNGTSISSAGTVTTVSDLNWNVAGVGDFDSDGRSDLFWHNSVTGQNVVWLMNGTSIATAALTNTVSDLNYKVVGVGDADGDTKADVFWWNQSTGDVVLWKMDGTSLVSAALITRVSDVNWHVEAVGDFDVDGKADLLWRKANTGDVVLWLMNGLTLKQATFITTVNDLNWSVVAPR